MSSNICSGGNEATALLTFSGALSALTGSPYWLSDIGPGELREKIRLIEEKKGVQSFKFYFPVKTILSDKGIGELLIPLR
jgi:hypothetical protein